MKCAICNNEFKGGYVIHNHNICDACGKQYSLKDIEEKLKEIIKNEEVTQSSMVDGGKISIFGSSNENDITDLYKELFELKDYNN